MEKIIVRYLCEDIEKDIDKLMNIASRNYDIDSSSMEEAIYFDAYTRALRECKSIVDKYRC